MSPKPGPRYGRSRRSDILRGAQLGVSIRRDGAAPRQLALTPQRRGLLEAVAAGKVKYHPSSGWRCDGKTVNALIREVVGAQWAREWVADGRPQIALSAEGEKAIGAGEPA